ncbi:Uncharacterized protein FWK35_00000222, partial [Aphis craccivora]
TKTLDYISTKLDMFLEISQAFNQVCHDSLLYTLKKSVPVPYFLLIRFYLTNRSFTVRINTIIHTQLVIKLLKQKSLEEKKQVKIKINESNSVQVTFSLRHFDSLLVTLNQWFPTSYILRPHCRFSKISIFRNNCFPLVPLQQCVHAPSLGISALTLDKCLIWGLSIKRNRNTANSRLLP